MLSPPAVIELEHFWDKIWKAENQLYNSTVKPFQVGLRGGRSHIRPDYKRLLLNTGLMEIWYGSGSIAFA